MNPLVDPNNFKLLIPKNSVAKIEYLLTRDASYLCESRVFGQDIV